MTLNTSLDFSHHFPLNLTTSRLLEIAKASSCAARLLSRRSESEAEAPGIISRLHRNALRFADLLAQVEREPSRELNETLR